MQFIRINTPKGRCLLPLRKVAEHRANYYLNNQCVGLEDYHKEFKRECKFIMDDDFEGIDWIINNTNWSDWEDKVEFIDSEVHVTDEDFWTDSEDFAIIDKMPGVTATTYLSIDAECPHCDHSQDIRSDIAESLGNELYGEDLDVNIECESCNEIFTVTEVIY